MHDDDPLQQEKSQTVLVNRIKYNEKYKWKHNNIHNYNVLMRPSQVGNIIQRPLNDFYIWPTDDFELAPKHCNAIDLLSPIEWCRLFGLYKFFSSTQFFPFLIDKKSNFSVSKLDRTGSRSQLMNSHNSCNPKPNSLAYQKHHPSGLLPGWCCVVTRRQSPHQNFARFPAAKFVSDQRMLSAVR